MAPWHPPRSLDLPFRTLLLQADPSLPAETVLQPEFEFSGGRTFSSNPAARFPAVTAEPTYPPFDPSKRWHPPQTLERPFRTLALQADPEMPAEAVRSPLYEFSGGRVFYCNPRTIHPFDWMPPEPPEGFAYLVDSDGNFLLDHDGGSLLLDELP
jgi:hypothetical protein